MMVAASEFVRLGTRPASKSWVDLMDEEEVASSCEEADKLLLPRKSLDRKESSSTQGSTGSEASTTSTHSLEDSLREFLGTRSEAQEEFAGLVVSVTRLRRTNSDERVSSMATSLELIPDTLEQVVAHVAGLVPNDCLIFAHECKAGLEEGYAPAHVESDSAGGCYYLRSSMGLQGIFKPVDEEPGSGADNSSFRQGVEIGEGYLREVAAFLLDQMHDGFAGVPPTVICKVFSKSWRLEDERCRSKPSDSVRSNASEKSQEHECGCPDPTKFPKSGLAAAHPLPPRPAELLRLQGRRALYGRSMSLCEVSSGATSRRDDSPTPDALAPGASLISGSLSLITSKMNEDEQVEAWPEDLVQVGLSNSLPSSPSHCSYALPSKLGSLQAYVSHHGSAEDVGPQLLSLDAVQRIAVLDLRILNLDRHLGNLLLKTTEAGTPRVCGSRVQRRSESFCGHSEPSDESRLLRDTEIRLVPIDHGLCLPSLSDLSRSGEEYGAQAITLEWMHWPQAKLPLLDHVAAHVDSLDAEADIALLDKANIAMALGPQALLTLRVSTMLLKEMVKRKFTMYDIASVIRSGKLRAWVEVAGCDACHPKNTESIKSFMQRFSSVLAQELPKVPISSAY